MGENNRDNNDSELFTSSHLMILLTYTILSVILSVEVFVMDWEKWALILIAGGVISAWYIYFSHMATGYIRLWICSAFMMVTFFFYGTHETSTYDLAVIMSVVIFLYTMTGCRSFIYLCQITYYITMAYEISILIKGGTVFDQLLISRTFMHLCVITLAGWLARTIIDKWEEVLGRSREEILAMNESATRLSDFIANVSHEIRTPINAILGLCGMCLADEEDEEKAANIKAIEDAGKRIGEQVSDILDYSEIDRKNLTNNFENYMLSSVLNDVVNELKPYLKSELELIIDVDASIPSVMNSDSGKIKTILKHLITNGIKYTNEGGVYVHISCVQHSYGINLCMEVRDTGIGMDPKQLEKIYDDFYKADSGRSRTTGGLGLGMIIVHGFVTSLGGFMTVESRPQEGTVVRVSIPNKVVDASECMSVRDRESISLGAYLHFEKYRNPSVREYYDSMVKNIVTGMKVAMHRVDNTESLRALTDSKKLTHLFAGPEEYESAPEFMEELAKTIIVTVVANPDQLHLPPGSRVRIMPKPFYCFPVVSVLNSSIDDVETDEGIVTFPGVRVLVVDDEPMNLIVTTGMLRRYGMDVSTCESGAESVKMCRENDYDVILMDHMMPVMDGVEAMKRIRADQTGGRPTVPIVAFTANAVSSAKEMFKNEGFDGFVGKPVDRIELERVLKKLLPNSYVITKEEPVRSSRTVKITEKTAMPKADDLSAINEEKAPVKSENAIMKRLALLGVDISRGLHYSNGDEEFYITLLMQYVKESHEKKRIMNETLASGDLKNYSVQAHSIKSTSKMIGAMKLSEAAKALEEAAKRGETDFINEKQEAMVAEYDLILKAIDPEYAESEDDTPDDEIFEFSPDGQSAEGGDDL